MAIDEQVGCSSISFRKLPLPEALRTIADLGFTETDLGALPGVCEHVPGELDHAAVDDVVTAVSASGLRVRSINADVGDLNRQLQSEEREDRRRHVRRLVELCEAVASPALVLPCGSQGHEPLLGVEMDIAVVARSLQEAADVARDRGVELWVESLHSGRLCYDMTRAGRLTEELAGSGVGVVMDFSHIVASGDDPVDFVTEFHEEVRHVHIRDAVPGDIHISVGNGAVDFRAGIEALASHGYTGHFSLELETRDVADSERPASAQRAGEYITSLLSSAGPST